MARYIVWRYEVTPGSKALVFNIANTRDVEFFFPNDSTLFVLERTETESSTPEPPKVES